jgi:hypothetical protein
MMEFQIRGREPMQSLLEIAYGLDRFVGSGLMLGGESYGPLQRFDFLWCERAELTHG